MSASPIPIHFGTYRDITRQLCDEIANKRADQTGFRSWVVSPVEVVIPSRSAAESIVAALLEVFPNGVSGLHLRTPETLAQQILNRAGHYPRVGSEQERRLAMELAARDTNDPLMDNRGIVALLERSYRDLRDSGLTTAKLQRKTSRLRDRARSALVAQVFARYEKVADALQVTDPADLLTAAVSCLTESPPVPQIVFGFYDVTGIQASFLQALRRAGVLQSIYIPAPRKVAAYAFAHGSSWIQSFAGGSELGARGSEPGAQPTEHEPHRPDPALSSQSSVLIPHSSFFSIARHRTRHEELRETCRRVATLLAGGVAPREIAIVCRAVDPHTARAAERFAAEHGFLVTNRSETSVQATRIGRAVTATLQLRERGFLRGDVIEIVRGGWKIRAEGSASADALDEMTRKHELAGGTTEMVDRAIRRIAARQPVPREIEAYRAIVESLERLTAGFSSAMRGSDWSDALERLVDLFPVETETDLAVVAAFSEIVSLYRSRPFAPTSFDSRWIVRTIENWDPIRPPRPDGATVWFGDVMKLRGRAVRHIFAVGLQHDVFPQSRTEDALIPNSDRRQLAMRIIDDGLAEEELLFQVIVDSAIDSLTFSYSATDGMGKELRPSQLLKNFAQQKDAESTRAIVEDFTSYVDRKFPTDTGGVPTLRERRLASILAGTAGTTMALSRRLRLASAVASRSIYDGFLDLDETLIQVVRERLSMISPTELERFGECPQQFLFHTLLRAREIEEPEQEVQIERRKKGMLDHDILENFYRQLTLDDYTAGPRLSPELAARLRAIVETAFDDYDASYPAVNPMIRAIERRGTLRVLEEFVTRDLADLADKGYLPQYFEYQFGKPRDGGEGDVPAVMLPAGGANLTVRGKIDRVDRHQTDGSYRIIDYKSGKALRQKKLSEKIDCGHRLQLALYAIASAKIFGVEDRLVRGIIKPIRGAGLKEEDYSFNLDEKRECLDETLDLFVASILSGSFPAYSNDEWCQYCPMTHGCRTKHDADERRRLDSFEHALALLRSLRREEAVHE